jgi:hypothetical protein
MEAVQVTLAKPLALAAPWSNSPQPGAMRYPGKHRLWLALFDHKVSLETIYAWRSGRRRTPQWARDMLANHLRRVGCEHLRIADELTKEKGTP